MFQNTQKPLSQVHGDGKRLNVVDIWRTIQGEGPLAGCPCVFVRLGGCNLQCPQCDTDYTTSSMPMETELIFKRVNELLPERASLLVLTGGEPFRQNLNELVSLCFAESIFVQIETNGTIFREDFQFYHHLSLMIVCSPKNTHVDERLIPYINAWKYVVKHGKVNGLGLPISSLGMSSPPFIPDLDGARRTSIFVSPQDDKDEVLNKQNLQTAIISCMDHGYRLSLQLHKLIGVD